MPRECRGRSASIQSRRLVKFADMPRPLCPKKFVLPGEAFDPCASELLPKLPFWAQMSILHIWGASVVRFPAIGSAGQRLLALGLSVAFLFGCGTDTHELLFGSGTVTREIPVTVALPETPAIAKLPLTLGVYYSPEFRNAEFRELVYRNVVPAA